MNIDWKVLFVSSVTNSSKFVMGKTSLSMVCCWWWWGNFRLPRIMLWVFGALPPAQPSPAKPSPAQPSNIYLLTIYVLAVQNWTMDMTLQKVSWDEHNFRRKLSQQLASIYGNSFLVLFSFQPQPLFTNSLTPNPLKFHLISKQLDNYTSQ